MTNHEHAPIALSQTTVPIADTIPFAKFGLAEPILRAILMEGYTEATPIQQQAIQPIIEGRDVIGCAQTGTGKTAAFALPSLHRLIASGNPSKGSGRNIRVLVLASTRELALQIKESFDSYGRFTPLRVGAVYGGVSQVPQEKAIRNGLDVLVATPGRLLDLMGQGFVSLQQVQCLVLDEADRMLDMGFLPAVRKIIPHIPSQRQTLLFSATMPQEIIELASDVIRNPIEIKIEPVRKTTELVDQHVCMVPQRQKTDLLIELIQELKPARAIVFTKTKWGADRIAKQLFAAQIKADAIHSNKSQNKRQRILDAFKWKNPPILIATDIAARGIDVDAVTHVFNFDMPAEADTYIHRIGRTGRAGASGMAISFCSPDEFKQLKSIEVKLRRKLPVFREVAPQGEPPRTSQGRNGGRSRPSDSSGSGSGGGHDRDRNRASSQSKRVRPKEGGDSPREAGSQSPYAKTGAKSGAKPSGFAGKKKGRLGKRERMAIKGGSHPPTQTPGKKPHAKKGESSSFSGRKRTSR